MATINMHMKFEIEIPKTNLTYPLETMSSTDRRTDGQTDGRTDKVNPVYPPPTSLGGGTMTVFTNEDFGAGAGVLGIDE